MLFSPFRFGLWARLAVVALLTGEAGGGGGGGIPSVPGNLPNFPKPTGDQHWRALAQLLHTSHTDWKTAAGQLFSAFAWKTKAAAAFVSEPGWEDLKPYLVVILAALVGVMVFVLLWIYCACVYRFILLDAVLTGECRLREGWRKWRDQGREYFLWVLAVGFIALLAFGIVIGIPVWLAYNAGWFQKPDTHVGALIGWGLLLLLMVLAVGIVSAVIDLFSRDFVIPMMALENVDALEGWRRLLGMLNEEKGTYALYVLMKIGLAMGAAIVFLIANLIVFLILLIPLGIAAIAFVAVGASLGLSFANISVVLLLIAAGLLVFAGILYVVAFVYTPGLVFFQSYALEFLAARYEPLARRLSTPPLGGAPPVGLPAPPTPSLPPPRLPANWVPRTS